MIWFALLTLCLIAAAAYIRGVDELLDYSLWIAGAAALHCCYNLVRMAFPS